MRFIIAALCVLACQTENKQPETAAESVLLSAEDFCKQQFDKRQERIAQAAIALENIPKNNDWEKLSEQAREKRLKPAKDHLAKLKADRQLHWPENWPTVTKPGEVFILPPKREAPEMYWVVNQSIDKSTALAFSPAVEKLRGAKVERFVVIQDLTPKQTSQKPNQPLELSGTWHRIDEIKIDGKTYPRIARWPHESEAKKLWPKYLAEHDLKQK